MAQRCGAAVGGKHLTFRRFSHCPFHWRRSGPALISLRFKVMPVKVLGCPVLRPLSAVPQGGLNAEKDNGGIMKKRLLRRTLLKGAGAFPLAAGDFRFSGVHPRAPAAPHAAA